MVFSWVWNSGSTVNGTDALWGGDEPNNKHDDQDCAVLWDNSDYKMGDASCSSTYGGICQIRPEET